MSELFRNKYRIGSARLKGWDYGRDGDYFVTICTKNQQEFFGKVMDEKIVLNELGKIVAEEWQRTEIIRKNVFLDKWVVMPNHIHGILVINNNYCKNTVETHCAVETHCNASLRMGSEYKNRFGHQLNNLSSIVRGFKSICTKRIRNIQPNFSWQPRFYDRIIRDEKEFNNVQAYIMNNPTNWKKDRNNEKNGNHFKKH